MKKLGAFEKVGADYLIECFGATYTNAYIEQHAKIIKEKSEMRLLMLISQKMTTAIQEGKKTVARELFKRNPMTTLTGTDIRRGAWTNALDSIAIEFTDVKADLRMIELHNEMIDDLLKILRPVCSKKFKSPIVFIDYL